MPFHVIEDRLLDVKERPGVRPGNGDTLRRRLGYAETLRELRRADYYALDLNVDNPDEALELARDMAEHTNQFVNPNKHAYEVRTLDQRPAGASESGDRVVSVLVTDPADSSPAGILSSLRSIADYGEQVRAVRRGVLWTLRLAADSDEQARGMAEDITVTRSQHQGLLMNPHFQKYEMWVGA